MKCSSRRNCNTSQNGASADALSLNEVQLPKELQLWDYHHRNNTTMPQ